MDFVFGNYYKEKACQNFWFNHVSSHVMALIFKITINGIFVFDFGYNDYRKSVLNLQLYNFNLFSSFY